MRRLWLIVLGLVASIGAMAVIALPRGGIGTESLLVPGRAEYGQTNAGDNAAGVLLVSFNIRYASANDGPDRWELRRDKVIATIEDLGADIVGLQEAEAAQVRELLTALPRYAAAGVHRDDGRTRGEACTILYDRQRFTIGESGVFWLSDTPEVVASKSWDNTITRQCVWARLIDMRSGEGLYVFNVHFDHRGQQSREKSAALVFERAFTLARRQDRQDAVVLLGDLNASEENPAIAILTRPADDDGGPRFRDSYRAVRAEGAAGTFNGFDPASDGGAAKIDYVFVGPGLKVLEAGIDRRTIDGRYPSDHFPVWARITSEK